MEKNLKSIYIYVYQHISIRVYIYIYLYRYIYIPLCSTCESESRSVVSDSLQPHGLWPTRLLCPWGFSRQEYRSGLPFPSPGDLPYSGIKPSSPAWQADSLPLSHQGSPCYRLCSPLKGSCYHHCHQH